MGYEEEEKKQYMVIKIKKPHHAERLGWMIVIAFLLTVVIYQWIYSGGGECQEALSPSPEKTPEIAPVSIETPSVTIETPIETSIKEKLPEEKKEKPLSGRIEFKITDVGVAKSITGLGKITSITYSIDNQKNDFVPLVRFYLFDSTFRNNSNDFYSGEFLRRCCEQTPLLSLPLKAGAPVLEKIFVPNFPSIRNLEEKKRIVLEVYDQNDIEVPVAGTEYELNKDAWK